MTTPPPGHEHAPAVALLPASAEGPAVVDPGDARERGGLASLARSGSLVAPAMMVANLSGYLLAVVASHALAPEGYGELSALLGVLLVASVPALALQAVVARSVARRPPGEPAGARERAALVLSARLGLGLGLAGAALAPLVGAFLHTGLAGPLWLAAGLLPLAVLSAAQGLLQGDERFGALAVLLCAQAAARVVGLVPLLLGGGAGSVLAGLALGSALCATAVLVVGRLASPARTRATTSRSARQQAAAVAPALPGLPTVRSTAQACGGLLALLLLSNLDLLLARHRLPGDASGAYAVGAVLTKAAFWLPQAVSVVAFPRLADPRAGARVLRSAVLVVAALGASAAVGALLLARPFLTTAFGEQYAPLASRAPLFVVQGAALALVQLLVYRGIALRRGSATAWVLGAVVVEAVVLLLLPAPGLGQVVAVAAATAVALALVVVVPALVRSRSAGPEQDQEQAPVCR